MHSPDGSNGGDNITTEIALDPERLKLVEGVREQWIARLIDKSRRNRLLFFRPLRLGTLELPGLPSQHLTRLLAGSPVRVSALLNVRNVEIQAEPLDLDEAAKSAEELPAIRKLQVIQRKATENLEDRGLDTMYLAHGMAAWPATDGGSNYNAPIILVPVTLEGKAGTLSLIRRADVEINLPLTEVLSSEFGLTTIRDDLEEWAAGLEEAPDGFPALLEIVQSASSTVRGLTVTPTTVVGNFQFQKMAMVRDLQRSLERIAKHDVVAAVAGDRSAMSALLEQSQSEQVDPRAFDRASPDNEFLIWDADSSQQVAIAYALRGCTGIISGPPGTGKSQTITNLIAEMVAAGKRVLFVAEKRAALDVVKARLTARQLDHLVLDIHGSITRKEIVTQLAVAVDEIRNANHRETDGAHAEFVRVRNRLVLHELAVHVKRLPAGLSAFELEGELLRAPVHARVSTRWYGGELDGLGSDVVGRWRELLDRLTDLSDVVRGTSRSRWDETSISTQEEANAATSAVRALLSAESRLGKLLDTLAQDYGLPAVESLKECEEASNIMDLAAELLDHYLDELFEEDLDALQSVLGEPTGRFKSFVTRAFDSDFRKARKTLQRLRNERVSSHLLVAELTRARSVKAKWVLPVVVTERTDLEAAASGLQNAIAACAAFGIAFTDRLSEIRHLATELDGQAAAAVRIGNARQLIAQLDQLGAGKLIEDFRVEDVPVEAWDRALLWAWYSSTLDKARQDDPELSSFDGAAHNRRVDEFQQLDKRRIEAAKDRVAISHARMAIAAMNAYPEAWQVVSREVNKKSRHKPLRKLLAEAGPIVTTLRPCWMASPLSVSQLIDTEEPLFDLVIFDEASQVVPEDAIPAFLRARRAVVAGDRKQLPPTPFFVSGWEVGDDAEVYDDDADVNAYESVLDLMDSGLPKWPLEWHYRSRDERLIAFANREVYDNRLVAFPGTGSYAPVTHTLVSSTSISSDGDESGSHEIEAVIQLIADHAHARPDETLGVIALSLKHARRIEAALDRRCKADESLAEFVDRRDGERFFVKNLERVQGDERDAIILSLGYTKDSSGRLLYRFGPLNMDGGERRLNVAITRSRVRMALVSSFDHHDMDPARSSRRGVQMLRGFMEYCANGGQLPTAPSGQIVAPNLFEADVEQGLSDVGIPLERQYGFSRYRIDLVAKHPNKPGAFVLAIECDGATYHSAPTARDRDRLRQQHLEALGWRFVRIWSTDWFLRRDEEIARVKRVYDDALQAFDRHDTPASPTVRSLESIAVDPSRSTAADTGVSNGRTERRPSLPRRSKISDYDDYELIRLMQWIRSDGILRPDEELLHIAADELGFKRVGSDIRSRLGRAARSTRT